MRLLRYRCPRCGGANLRIHAQVACVVLQVPDDDPERDQYPAAAVCEHVLEGEWLDFGDDSPMLCNNYHCEYTGIAKDFE